MTTTINNTIDTFKDSRTTEDLVVLLTALHPDDFKTKADARKYLEDNGVKAIKPKTKKQLLNDWFLDQEDPLAVTKDQLKDACKTFDMRGGSVDFYATAYMMAIDVHKQLTK